MAELRMHKPVLGNFKDRNNRKKNNSDWRERRDGMSDVHLGCLRKLGCLRCGGRKGMQVHHLKCTGERGIGVRSTDKWGVPLCAGCHHEVERAGARIAAFASESKDEFVAEARAAVEEAERDLGWAKDQLAKADDAARADWQALVDELEEHQRRAVAELEKIEEAEEDAWAELRHGFIAAYHDLKVASSRAAERLAEV